MMCRNREAHMFASNRRRYLAGAAAAWVGVVAGCWLVCSWLDHSIAQNIQPLKTSPRSADSPKASADLPPQVAELFHELAQHVDHLQLGSGERMDIEPVVNDAQLEQELGRAGVTGYVSFEQQALDAVAKFEKTATELPMLQRLTALENG